MRIRVATPDDAAMLVDFNAAMARETEAKELLPEVIGAGVRSLLANPASGFYVVAEEDGRSRCVRVPPLRGPRERCGAGHLWRARDESDALPRVRGAEARNPLLPVRNSGSGPQFVFTYVKTELRP
jgi:hypothetical protein